MVNVVDHVALIVINDLSFTLEETQYFYDVIHRLIAAKDLRLRNFEKVNNLNIN